MATNYTELKAEVQQWLDNNNPNLVAAIPTFIEFAETWFRRHLHTREMECRAIHALVPTGTVDADRGIYTLPANWGGHRTVEIQIEPAELTLLYWQRIPALSDSEPTNWLLTKHPDLYLHASLSQAESWLKNDPRIPLWAQAANTALAELESHDEHDRYSGGPIDSLNARRRPWVNENSLAGRYDYLPPFDFFDLDLSGIQPRYRNCPGYFTVAEDKLRIWPRPQTDPTGTAGWSACP